MSRSQRLVRRALFVAAVAASVVVPFSGISAALPAWATISGHYRIVSTDCYFGSARCYPLGTLEDGWIAVGTTTDRGQTVSGTMSDGIGGTGNFVIVFVRP